MYFAWKEEYSVNIEEIDNQHKRLFEIGRKVSKMVFSNEIEYTNEDIMPIFHELRNYTYFHFKCEEDLMREYDYVHFETHKCEHDDLIERIDLLESEISLNLDDDTLMKLINLVFDWISNHMFKCDKKYKDMLLRKE